MLRKELGSLSGFHHLLEGVLPALFLNVCEERFLRFVIRRTVYFNKLAEDIPRSQFLCGLLNNGIIFLPPVKSLSKFYSARVELEKQRLIFFDHPMEYSPNVFGMLDILSTFIPAEPELVQALDITRELLKAQGVKMQALAMKKEILMNIDAAVRAGNKKFIDASKKRAKKPLTSQWVEVYLKELVGAADMRYVGPASETERVKMRRCMKNWLAECTRDGVNPKGVLQWAVDFWSEMAQYTLSHRETGREIRLGTPISFQAFFNYRAEIFEYLRHKEGAMKTKDGVI